MNVVPWLMYEMRISHLLMCIYKTLNKCIFVHHQPAGVSCLALGPPPTTEFYQYNVKLLGFLQPTLAAKCSNLEHWTKEQNQHKNNAEMPFAI